MTLGDSSRRQDLAPPHGEIVLYVDESGDHGMQNIDPGFPILTIAGCAFTRDDYRAFEQDVTAFKKTELGNAEACIHSRDIRKWEGDFAAVHPRDRKRVQNEVSEFMRRGRFTLITVTIRKDRLGESYTYPQRPYELGIAYLLERFYALLRHSRSHGIVCPESRGKREDAAVSDEYSGFRKKGFSLATAAEVQGRLPGPIIFGRKSDGCVGLEAADLAAYPVARYILDPSKANPAFEVLKPKLYAGNQATTDYKEISDPDSEIEIDVGGSTYFGQDSYQKRITQYGLKVFP
jgi:hypothetical protein